VKSSRDNKPCLDPLCHPLLFHFPYSVTVPLRSELPDYGALRRHRIAILAYPPCLGLLVPSSIMLSRLPSLSPITFRPRLPMSRLTNVGPSRLGHFFFRRFRSVLCSPSQAARPLPYPSFFSRFLPGRQGFILRSVTRLLRPWVLSTTRESATLCPLRRIGFSSSASVL